MISSDSSQNSMMSLLFRLGGTLEPTTDGALLPVQNNNESFDSLFSRLQQSVSSTESATGIAAGGEGLPLPPLAGNQQLIAESQVITGTPTGELHLSGTYMTDSVSDEAMMSSTSISEQMLTSAGAAPVSNNANQIAGKSPINPMDDSISEAARTNRDNFVNPELTQLNQRTLGDADSRLSQSQQAGKISSGQQALPVMQTNRDHLQQLLAGSAATSANEAGLTNLSAGLVNSRQSNQSNQSLPVTNNSENNTSLASTAPTQGILKSVSKPLPYQNLEQPVATNSTLLSRYSMEKGLPNIAQDAAKPLSSDLQNDNEILINRTSSDAINAVTPSLKASGNSPLVVGELNAKSTLNLNNGQTQNSLAINQSAQSESTLPSFIEPSDENLVNGRLWQNPNQPTTSGDAELNSTAMIRANLQSIKGDVVVSETPDTSATLSSTAAPATSTFSSTTLERPAFSGATDANEFSAAIEQAQQEQDDFAAGELKFGQDRREWSGALGQRIMTMVAQDIQQAKIQLDPPELGALEIKLQIQQDQASVQIHAQHGQVREVLEQNIFRLKEALQQQGIELSDSEFTDAEQSLANQGSEQQDSSGSSSSPASVDKADVKESANTELETQTDMAANQKADQQGIINQQGRLDTFV